MLIHVYQLLLCLNTGWSSQNCWPCHIAVECKKMSMHQTWQNSCKWTFLDQCGNEFGSSKIYLSMFMSFYCDWTLAEAAKIAGPTTLLLSAKLWRCINHCKTPANKSSLTSVALILVQIKYTYPCLQSITMTEHWLKQPKVLPCLIVVECQTRMMHQPPQNSCK